MSAAGRGWSVGSGVPADDVDWVAVERAVAGDRTISLTPAECADAVRRLNRRGWSDNQIAAQLGLSDRTVLRYRKRLELAPASGPWRPERVAV